MRYQSLVPGDTAPWFHQRSLANPRYAFDTAGGRYVLLCFLGTARHAAAAARMAAVRARPDLFDDGFACFFGVTADPSDEAEGRIRESYPGYRFFVDADLSVARLYGASPVETPARGEGRSAPYRPLWVLLDPTLRVLAVIPFREDGGDAAEAIAALERQPPVERFAGFPLQAPVLVLPNVFDGAMCRRLIDLYEADGGEESGFMREVDGKTVPVHDHSHKRRRDCLIRDEALVKEIQGIFLRKVVPQIRKAHQFQVTRMERYIVGCYTAEDRGHFRAHRDNTTKGTAHRRFAVSVNLNDAFEGGEVSFPEYGPRSFKPPAGGAVVFSCSLLHAVSPVTAGRRYAFLPFLYDDAAAKIREANNRFLGEGVGAYPGAAKPAAGAAEAAAPARDGAAE